MRTPAGALGRFGGGYISPKAARFNLHGVGFGLKPEKDPVEVRATA